jgi:hypothetical protein
LFVFCDGSQYVDCEPISLGEVYSVKFDPAFHQPGYEGDVPGEPVQFSDD